MRLGFTFKSAFNRLFDKKVGDVAITENLGLIVKEINGNKMLTDGLINNATSGSFQVAGLLVQFGRVTESTTPFTISFPTQFADDNVFGFIQEAGNDAPGTFNSAQLDGSNLPDRNGMTVIVESASGSEFYFWLAIGKA